MAACAAQPFFQYRASHPRVRAREQAGRMELHHFHVAQRQPGAKRHRETIAALVARRRVEPVHRRAAAGGEQHARACTNSGCAGAHVDHRDTGERAIARGDEVDRAMLLEPPDPARPDLLGEPADDLDAGQVALVDGAIERLPGECLLVDRTVRIAIEEAAELVLQLADALDGAAAQRPREILVGQPLAAFDRVHEVALDRIAGRERDVVAALDHARAAALAEQSLDGDRDVERRVDIVRVQRREEARAAGAENQDVGVSAAAMSITADVQRGERGCAAVASRAVDGVVEARPVAVHRDEQRPEIAHTELPQALGIQIVEIDVLDRLDPCRFERGGAADDREVDAAKLGKGRERRGTAGRPCR